MNNRPPSSTAFILPHLKVVDEEKTAPLFFEDKKHQKLFNELDRLLAKGPIDLKRFVISSPPENHIEKSLYSNQISLLKKNPLINHKGAHSTKFNHEHFHKPNERTAYAEFSGATLVEFLYPEEEIAAKTRLVVQNGYLGITSKAFKNTKPLNEKIKGLSSRGLLFATPEELDVDPLSLCKVKVIADFLGLTDNHSGNERKTENGQVVRIDFEHNCAILKPLTLENKAIKKSSMVDPGLCFRESYIQEVERISMLSPAHFNLVLKKIDSIIDLYKNYQHPEFKAQVLYKNRLGDMEAYAKILRQEQRKRIQLEKTNPLEYLKLRYHELALGNTDWADDPHFSNKDPHQSAYFILEQSRHYQNKGLTLNQIIKACLPIREETQLNFILFQILFIINAEDNNKLKEFIAMAHQKRNKAFHYPLLWEMTAFGIQENLYAYSSFFDKDTVLKSLLIDKQEILDVLFKIRAQLKAIGIENPHFPHQKKSFKTFEEQCLSHFERYQTKILQELSTPPSDPMIFSEKTQTPFSPHLY